MRSYLAKLDSVLCDLKIKVNRTAELLKAQIRLPLENEHFRSYDSMYSQYATEIPILLDTILILRLCVK